ncbi:MAG: VCBS repeat-containing protein [Candidatus Delongbacteria bacterium]
MRIRPRLLTTGVVLASAGSLFAQDAWVARIDSPADRSLTSGPVAVTVEVHGPQPGTWRLLDEQAGTTPVLLAAGSGAVTADQPVYQGSLPAGPHRLVLELLGGPAPLTDEQLLVVCAPTLPGWPYQQNPAAIPFDQELMAESVNGEVLLVRPLESERQGVAAGQLVWLDGQGAALPGWPLSLTDLLQSLSPHSDPLHVRRGAAEHMLLVSKTAVLELDRSGGLVAQSAVDGLILGEPVLLPVPGAGYHTLLWVQQETLRLCRFDEQLTLVENLPLEGSPCWPRPLLADLSGDGRLDVVLPLRLNGFLRLQVLDAQSGALSLFHQMLDPGLTGLQAGDLNGDGRPELVLAGGQGLVLALDADGLRWTHNLGEGLPGALALADGDGDGRQEVSLLARDAAGVRFVQLDAAGLETAASGTLVAEAGEASLAPLLLEGGPAGSRWLVTVQPREPASWAARLLLVSPDGSLEQPDWWLPTLVSGPPRLVDLDGDGAVELLAGDAFGRWVAWPTAFHDPAPDHPLGSARHDGLTLQPVPAGSHPGHLGGAVALPDDFLLPFGTEVADLELVSGRLTVTDPWQPLSLRVAPGAELHLLAGAAWGGDSPVPLRLEGRLTVSGNPDQLDSDLRTLSTSNGILGGMALDAGPGSLLRLESVELSDLAQMLEVGAACTLEVESSHLLAGSRGLRVDGGVLRIHNSLLQPGSAGLTLNQGRAEIRGSVITAAAAGVALDCQSSLLELRDCSILTCGDGVRVGGSSSALLDSVHFQGNQRDLRITDNASLSLNHCDFVETHQLGLENSTGLPLTARGCFWNLRTPAHGPVLYVDNKSEPIKPLVIPRPVFRVDTGPMVDGDDPLEWEPVEFSVDGLPIKVQYRVYRSSKPYQLVEPGNLVAETALTSWQDPDPLPASFYCVTASIGKPAAE